MFVALCLVVEVPLKSPKGLESHLEHLLLLEQTLPDTLHLLRLNEGNLVVGLRDSTNTRVKCFVALNVWSACRRKMYGLLEARQVTH
jgi:hypothetical protein